MYNAEKDTYSCDVCGEKERYHMNCSVCGRVLKSEKSKELGYGPVCYKKIFGGIRKRKNLNGNDSSIGVFHSQDIPGQVSLDEYLKSLT